MLKEVKHKKHKEWRDKNPDKIKHYTRNWKSWWLKKQYNMTIEEYNQMFIEQNGCCAICNTHQSELEKALAVDHNHETKEIRGLLCMTCNRALGLLKDDRKLLIIAAGYLK